MRIGPGGEERDDGAAAWSQTARVEVLDNGLTVCLLPDDRVPLVASALWFRVGARDEAPGQGGTAHFLEHMMFKGSERYPPGAVDRCTQRLGGSNNAFTSHDATVYHFTFASDRWQAALDIEADRMAGLTLDPREVETERRVILEEISMVEDDPWGRLEERVAAELFGEAPYGRPVLGSREEVAAATREQLRAFHRRHCRPCDAVLALVGDLEPSEALERVLGAFGDIGDRGAARPAPRGSAVTARPGRRRVQLDRGEVARLFLALPAPASSDPEHPALRLALAVLASGRSSVLQRTLVEEGQLASWLSLELSETVESGLVSLVLEVAPGVEPDRVEAAARRGIQGLGRRPPEPEELERAKALLRAEWSFAHERLHQRALTLGGALAFHQLDHPSRYRQALERLGPEEVSAAAARWIDPEADSVVGWSLPGS